MQRNFFLKNHTQNGGGVTSSRTFSNKSKLSISLDQQSKVLYFLLLFTIATKVWTTCLRKAF